MTTYVLGGGCFWCIDAVFRRLKGVQTVESGYAGGGGEPNYYSVASGTTGHAEVVRVTFDSSVIPEQTLLAIFFLIHNPTTLNRQGADEGTQYRSVMFYASDTQRKEFEEAVAVAQELWEEPIVTELAPLETFFTAEDEHQDYFNKNPTAGYCSIVIEPKIVKARAAFAQWFKG